MNIENQDSLILQEILKLNEKVSALSADVGEIKAKVRDIETEVNDKMRPEVAREMERIEAEMREEVTQLKAELGKGQLQAVGEMKEKALSVVFSKMSALSENIKGQLAEATKKQDMKMEETSDRLTMTIKDLRDKVYCVMDGRKGLETHSPEVTLTNPEVTPHHGNLSEMETSIGRSKLEMSNFALVNRNDHFRPAFVWTITGISDLKERLNFELISDPFDLSSYPFRARAIFTGSSRPKCHIRLRLEPKEEGAELRPRPKVSYVLMDRLSGARHKCRTVTYTLDKNLDHSSSFSDPLIRRDHLTHELYNENDSIVIQIHVEPPQMTKACSYNGTLEWAIEDYENRVRAERKGLVLLQESPYFYTGPNGYRVCVGMRLTEVQGQALTAQVVFVSGENDDHLPRHFRHRTTVTLVSRKWPQYRLITRSIDADLKDKKTYEVKMCGVNQVNNFVNDDTLLCRVTIKPTSGDISGETSGDISGGSSMVEIEGFNCGLKLLKAVLVAILLIFGTGKGLCNLIKKTLELII